MADYTVVEKLSQHHHHQQGGAHQTSPNEEWPGFVIRTIAWIHEAIFHKEGQTAHRIACFLAVLVIYWILIPLLAVFAAVKCKEMVARKRSTLDVFYEKIREKRE